MGIVNTPLPCSHDGNAAEGWKRGRHVFWEHSHSMRGSSGSFFLSLQGEQRVNRMLERLGGISEEHSCHMTGMLVWPFEEGDT